MIKLLSNICEDTKRSLKETKAVLCDYVSTPSGMVKHTPFLSTERECEWCGGTAHYCPCVDPKTSASRTWLCANHLCVVYTCKTSYNPCLPTNQVKRALEWPVFCELNGIGDVNYDVRFENINQSEGKISYMLKFVTTPRGFILMQGDKGTGKTYAAMAMCELFTRTRKECVFTTQKQMSNNWMNSIGDPMSIYVNTICSIPLLVIDDFGLGEPNPKFLEFFMDIINTRMQWKERGTVITTNLEPGKFATFCGEALSDRINTGQQFEFRGKTRRKPTVL